VNEGILWMISIGWIGTIIGVVCLGFQGKEFAAAALIAGSVFMAAVILGRAWERPCQCQCEEDTEDEKIKRLDEREERV
jgi:hypothetical protein